MKTKSNTENLIDNQGIHLLMELIDASLEEEGACECKLPRHNSLWVSSFHEIVISWFTTMTEDDISKEEDAKEILKVISDSYSKRNDYEVDLPIHDKFWVEDVTRKLTDKGLI